MSLPSFSNSKRLKRAVLHAKCVLQSQDSRLRIEASSLLTCTYQSHFLDPTHSTRDSRKELLNFQQEEFQGKFEELQTYSTLLYYQTPSSFATR